MHSVGLSCDILAIRCIDKFIIAPVGNQLHIFYEPTLKLLEIIDTFHADNIHDIVRINDNRLILFGGRCLSVYQFQIINGTIIMKMISYHNFNDWIIAASINSSINFNDNIYILFGHNNLYNYNTVTKNIENILCEEKCILYTGCISINNSNEVVIFSGTVFQEILIWQINNEEKYSSDVAILYRLKGHKGVIFSIYYDPLLKLISSTSDDRTIRIWEINDKFSTSSSIINWNNIEIILKITIFGHNARVWKSIIVNDKIISIGEDSLICIWKLDGTLCNKIVGHDGATIWSITVSEDKTKIFTGGADGGLNSFPLINNSSSIPNETLTFNNNKTPKFICYLKSGMIGVFIDGGELLYYNDYSKSLNDSINLTRYKSYCIMKISPDRTRIALGSNDGHVDIFKESIDQLKLQQSNNSIKIMDSKIFSLQWLNNNMMLICGAQGCLIVIKINKDDAFEVQSEFILPSSRERWTTAAIIIDNLLICGDRAGSIYIFSMKSDSTKNPLQFFSKIHGRLGVQSFGIIGNKIVSTGRDASLRYYKMANNNSGTLYLQALHWKKMPMEWISETLKSHDDFYVIGFKEIEFMIYSIRLNRVILRIECGGGHRSWDCVLSNDIINFAYIRNKQVHTLNNLSCKMNDSLIIGYHTKEIHALECLNTTKNHNIIVSGSEDCTLRIASIEMSNDNNKYYIKPLEKYDGHISNVKCIAIINIANSKECTKNIVFTGGGRAQLKVWEVSVDVCNDKLSQDDLTVIEKTTFMLRGTDKVRRKTWLDNKQSYFIDPETRFMNISAITHHENNNFIILFVACSDGFIRILSYDINSNNLKFNIGLAYYHRCVLKVHTFYHENELILLSMATDGFVNFWSMNSTIDEIFLYKNDNNMMNESILEPYEKWKVQQSGINSYDFRMSKLNEYYLATGGDDNKMNLIIFTIIMMKSKQMSIEILATWNTVCSHSAQITGIKFIDDDKLLSVAIDQRIVMYCYSYSNSNLLVSPIKTITTFVSDVQGMALFYNENEDKNLTCIYGKGVEIVSIHDEIV